MLLSTTERDRRWVAAREFMADQDLDAIIARGTPDANGHLRYLTLFVPIIDSAACVFFRDGTMVLAVTDGVQAYYAAKTSWAEAITIGSLVDELLVCLKQRQVKRVGIAAPEGLPYPWCDALREWISPNDIVDVGEELTRLRWVKSSEEIALVRSSCHAADAVWSKVETLVRSGRRVFEVLADVEHSLRLHGCDGSFNLVIPLPDAVFDRLPSSRALEEGDTFILEVSPQYGGYFSQLTSVVSIGPADTALRDSFDAGVRARAAAESDLAPGADLASVSKAIAADLRATGYEMSSPDIGHLCGLELNEPRVGIKPLRLQSGMVLIFHPIVADPKYRFVMRGDTYLITEDGAERLTTHPTELQECA